MKKTLVFATAIAVATGLIGPSLAPFLGSAPQAAWADRVKPDKPAKILKPKRRAKLEAQAAQAGTAAPSAPATAATGAVLADFSALDYFPNLKSKFGFAANFKSSEIADAGQYLNEIGPGLVCNNLEFDHWFKWQTDPVPALMEKLSTSGRDSGRPVETLPTPGKWLWNYETMVGDLNVALLVQLTGAPAQFQVPHAQKPAPHPAPTDPAGAAQFAGEWVAAAKHAYPVMWSLWNEPGHTLAGIDRQKNVAGDVVLAKESASAFDAREKQQFSLSAAEFSQLFGLYSAAMRPSMSPYSRFGLASLLAIDFKQATMSSNGKVYFKELFDQLAKNAPKAAIDYVTFNSFSGGYSVMLNGTRAFLGARKDIGPVIITQYAPRSLKINDDGGAVRDAGKTDVSPLAAATDMLGDMAQFERATDLQHVCLSYWVRSNYGFLTDDTGTLQPDTRYNVLKLFTALPILRTSLDFSASGLEEQGIHGLAGINSAKAAILLWNDTDSAYAVPLTLAGLPPALTGAAAQATVSTLSEDSPDPQVTPFDGSSVTLPPHGVVLLEIRSPKASDPLNRRAALSGAPTQTKFLQTRSFPDRVTAACPPGSNLPGAKSCMANTGTYGFYDSVRAVAYLGKGAGGTPARVEASFETLPDQIYLNAYAYPSGQVQISVAFPSCGKTVTGTASAATTLDLTAIPSDCRAGQPATITLSLDGVPTGTQAEVYLSATADPSVAHPSVANPKPDLPSVKEGLTVASSGD